MVSADTVVVPALPGDYVEGDARLDPDLLDALRAAHGRGARMVSLRTGAFARAAGWARRATSGTTSPARSA